MNATYRMLLIVAVVLAWFAPTAHARWYDPTTGRWLQRDPSRFINGMNQYQYVVSNPIRFIDRSGMAAEEPPDAKPMAEDPNAIYGDPSRGCGIKVKQNDIGNGYGHRWIEIAEPGKPTRSLGFYPSGSKKGKDKGSGSAFGGKGVWMSPNANESDSNDTCGCVRQNDPAHGQPGDTVWDVELDPSHLTPDEISGGDGLDRGPGGRPLDPPKIISWKIVEHKLRFGSGAGTLVKDATCDQIRECLDRFLSNRSYTYGVHSCRGASDEALSACGLKRK